MAYNHLMAVSFGSTKTGLSPSYQLKNQDGTNNGAKVTTGIVEISSGYYQTLASIPDSHVGGILWSSEEGTPKYVYHEINPGMDEYTDVIISSRAVGVGTGTNTVTITLTETGGTPVLPGATVTVKNQAGDTVLAIDITDANGKASFMLDDGTYSVYSSLRGHTFTLPETLVVSGNTNQSYIGAPISISAPAQPNTCRMFIWARNPDGTLMTTLTGNSRITALPYKYSSSAYEGQEIAFTKHIDGYWYVDLVYGATAEIYIVALGVGLSTTVPAQATKDISELL